MSLHITGSKTAETNDGQLDASDLLGDDGRIDLSAVHSRSKQGVERVDRLPLAEVDEIRRRLRRGESASAVATDLGRSAKTTRKHARGQIAYTHVDGSPAEPPVEYGRGGWRVRE